MLGWIICKEGNCSGMEMRLVCDVPFLVLERPVLCRRRADRRAVNAALGEMARRGVRRAVVQGGAVPELAAFGILPLDPSALRMALLPRILTWAEEAWELKLRRGTVLLSADASCGAVYRAAEELSRAARYVLLDTGPGQAALEQVLRSRTGLGSGGPAAVLEVCMGCTSHSHLPQLHLGRGCADRQRMDVWSPQAADAQEEMLCALFLAEKIPIEQIYVRFVEFRA